MEPGGLELQLVIGGDVDEGAPAEGPLEASAKSLIQTAVDDGVVHGRAHGQPEAGQVDLLDVFPSVQLLIDRGEDEINVIGQPADGKGHHHNNHHFYNLSLGLQLLVVLVTGVSWDLPSPQCDPNDGVGDAHDEQWKAVHQDDDDDVVREMLLWTFWPLHIAKGTARHDFDFGIQTLRKSK